MTAVIFIVNKINELKFIRHITILCNIGSYFLEVRHKTDLKFIILILHSRYYFVMKIKCVIIFLE